MPILRAQGCHHHAKENEKGAGEDEAAEEASIEDRPCDNANDDQEKGLDGAHPGDIGIGLLAQEAALVEGLVDAKGINDSPTLPRQSDLLFQSGFVCSNLPAVEKEKEGAGDLKPSDGTAIWDLWSLGQRLLLPLGAVRFDAVVDTVRLTRIVILGGAHNGSGKAVVCQDVE